MTNDDDKQLDLLSLFHYILGGFTALFSCFPMFHVVIGISVINGRFMETAGKTGAPEALFGWLFVIMGSLFILAGWSLAICMLMAGKKLKARTGRTFCMVVAGIECMLVPLGTVLGVFTLILLSKETVKELFVRN